MADQHNADISADGVAAPAASSPQAARNSPEPAPATAAPDWAHQADDLFCPLCEYNLRGLTEPRCPECGYRFEWPDLLDPRRRLHPYLFEHHPEKNFRSFWETAIGGWRPRRFWTSLHPVQPSRPRRLLLYWCLSLGTVFLAYIAAFNAIVVNAAAACEARQRETIAWLASSEIDTLWRDQIIRRYGSAEAFVTSAWPSDYATLAKALLKQPELPLTYLVPAVPLLAWPWLSLLALLLFRWSMRRAKIGMIHVLRCLLYSSDFLIWYGLLTLALTPVLVWDQSLSAAWWGPRKTTVRGVSGGWNMLDLGMAVAALMLFIAVYRLAVAYRRYLRFDHPVATILASQIIVVLIAFNAILAYNVWL